MVRSFSSKITRGGRKPMPNHRNNWRSPPRTRGPTICRRGGPRLSPTNWMPGRLPPRKRNFRNCRKWTELPDDVTASILSRLGAIEILESAQLVCNKWRKICKDPLMWRTIDMRKHDMDFDMELEMRRWHGDDDGVKDVDPPAVPLLPDHGDHNLEKMCRHAVDRSFGNLVDITLDIFATDELLKYITQSSSGIKRLRLLNCDNITDEGLIEVASKLPLLEDLDLTLCLSLKHNSLEVVGRSCPLLKAFKWNTHWLEKQNNKRDESSEDDDISEDDESFEDDEYALAISRTMPGLQHLQIFGNQLTNKGLCAILDCCPRLESLDLRYCFYLDLGGDLGRRCADRIKELRLPHDSVADYEFCPIATVYDKEFDEESDSDDNELDESYED